MARHFSEIGFTPAVKAAQERHGSRAAYSRVEGFKPSGPAIGAQEAAFIAARDGFYQATVTVDGWPYVQYRGGPTGFLKHLGEDLLGYADFSGNRQYLSVGNLTGNERVALILMDYARQRRLKVWARAQLIDPDDAPDLLQRLALPDYRARVERGVLLRVEAMDWNCPQHITPRFTEAEIAQAVAPLAERIRELEALLAEKET